MSSQDSEINILIPIVGRGSRLKEKYNLPKPLVVIDNKTIIEHCISSFKVPGRYIFVVRKYDEYENGRELVEILKTILRHLKPDCSIIQTDEMTEGPASSALLAKEYINNDNPLIITNCDQKTLWNPHDFLTVASSVDGCVTTYNRPDIVVGQKSKYSFIKLNEEHIATHLVEKFAISDLALNGIHYWKHGKDFVSSAEEMIKANVRVNNEFYISETYNFLIKMGKVVKHYQMKDGEFLALGDIQELEMYNRLIQ